jgi:putative SOS response-associated peptidase YedK
LSLTDNQQRASFVRHQLQQQGLPVDEAPNDDEARETYNFPPGAYGLVYRADVPDSGAPADNEENGDATEATDTKPETYNYQIKTMKWGLVPFWTKRSPDYGSMLKTINCRDDSLIEDRGMWTTMKRKKRCLVVAQGFYEWLKKGPGGKEKVPHFVKRKDGNLMCFAGLWDCVQYEDGGDGKDGEKLYTYTIITTDSNKQLKFLHDRMPVILEPDTDAVKTWLDPKRNKWSKELQSLLKPFEGELECYPVSKEVGKVGNNSPDFIIPVDSKENKNNIANFFGNAKTKKEDPTKEKPKKEPRETRATIDHESTEDNAPVPVPEPVIGKKHALEEEDTQPDAKQQKLSSSDKSSSPVKTTEEKIALSLSKTTAEKAVSPQKATGRTPRSGVSNAGATMKASPNKNCEKGTQRITSFFGK